MYHLRDVRAALGTHFWNSQRLFFEKIWWCIQMILYGESLLKPAPSEYLNCLDTLLNAAEAKHWTSSSISKGGLYVYLQDHLPILEKLSPFGSSKNPIETLIEFVMDGQGWFEDFCGCVENKLQEEAYQKITSSGRIPNNWKPPSVNVPSDRFPLSSFPDWAIADYERNLADQECPKILSSQLQPHKKLIKHLDYALEYFNNLPHPAEYPDSLTQIKQLIINMSNRSYYRSKLDDICQYLGEEGSEAAKVINYPIYVFVYIILLYIESSNGFRASFGETSWRRTT